MLSDAERLDRRTKWAAAVKAYAGQPAPAAATSAQAYYARLAAIGLPPVIRAAPFDRSREPETTLLGIEARSADLPLKPVSVATPDANGLRAWQEGQLALLVSSANPVVKCEAPPPTARVSTARVTIMPWLASLSQGDIIEDWDPLPRPEGAVAVRLESRVTALRLSVAEKDGTVASAPRVVQVRCPRNLTVTEPLAEMVTEPALTVRGQVWCESGDPRVMVGDNTAVLGPAVDGVRPWACENLTLPEGP